MSGGVAMRPIRTYNDEEQPDQMNDVKDALRHLVRGQRPMPQAPVEAPVAPQRESIDSFLTPKPAQPSGGQIDPNTLEVVPSPDGVKFRDPKSGAILTGMDLRKLEGHERKLYEGTVIQDQLLKNAAGR